ncbi:MAG: bifunctional pyr operon transcriptional regulator/uracil phosphoribosyltransferase PyrR, partial [Candidatus Dadabacteria bacterium]|nr:bifunctional pyr operon transcriptional regulator/uracil phosphoribosyltransferase PyrR [Candidatus Dadabacteria bacterium]MDE0519286.1 bifunctional pyr operon transcriptional regulator/uracil phosphoribosyltransferase PyrR [Candidatus Dadabacteria bacterium]MDE0663890.1 bifunctional pyr operon transcriptional regulator/uracil phosphoribosyltransferase PyrR [Candidatus Dadabacteria bacterium]
METKKKIQPIEDRAEIFFSGIIDDIPPERLSSLIVIGIKTRGEYLGKRLVERISERTGKDVTFGTIDITLYRDDFENRKNWPRLRKTSIPNDVQGKNIILVDDVLYTGRTVRAAINSIMDYGRPASVKLAVLVDRGGRELPVQPDYAGISIETLDDEMVNVYLEEVDGREEIEIIRKNGV